jgi:ketol-acid reductoisomerase
MKGTKMNIYYDKDADPESLREKQIAVIGYGSQGFAQANNLQRLWLQRRVGLRANSASWEKAEQGGTQSVAGGPGRC